MKLDKPASLKVINAAIAHTGLELIKGEGYHYFIGDGIEDANDWQSSVLVCHTNFQTLGTWIRDAEICAAGIKTNLEKYA